MEEDDEFRNLYAGVLRPFAASSSSAAQDHHPSSSTPQSLHPLIYLNLQTGDDEIPYRPNSDQSIHQSTNPNSVKPVKEPTRPAVADSGRNLICSDQKDEGGQNFQILVESPDLPIRSHALTFSATQNQTLNRLKSIILPSSIPSDLLSSFYFTLNGKQLDDNTTILGSQINLLSTLILRSRVRGGGGDGGATGAESRDCYLNMYAEKKPDKVDPNEQRLSKWLNCALSNEPLREPCVLDRLGNIFNKEALVEALLGKKLPKEFGHIKGLKDMINIHLSMIPGAEDVVGGTRFQCPISGLEFNGKYKFFALKECGHVLSAKALKEVKSSSCLVCHDEFYEMDKIVINGSEEEVDILRERMEEEKAKLREKKSKKVKNGKSIAVEMEGGNLESSRLSGSKHGLAMKAVEKVSPEVGGNGKVDNGLVDPKSMKNGGLKRFKAADIAPPNATKEVYASIFTSSRKSEFKETFTCRSLPIGRN